MTNIYLKFVSNKISKIRWQKDYKERFRHESPSTFVIGSWGNLQDNCISYWEYKPNDTDNSSEPSLLSKTHHSGDVTGLEFISESLLATSSSNGSVSLYSLNSQNLKKEHQWDQVHSSWCNGFASKENEICSIGEDGKLALLNLSDNSVNYLGINSTCSLSAIKYLRHNEIITSNIRGTLKLWDLRQNSHSTAYLTNEQRAITSIAVHPTQFHIVATGGEDGVFYLWDMRQFSQPISAITGHSGPISELKFHPTQPNHLFTSSLDGGIWHWNVNTTASLYNCGVGNNANLDKTKSVWLSTNLGTSKIEINALSSAPALPINCLDIETTTLICGSDNEAIYILPLNNL